jgi:hypothetical protein
MGGLETWLLAKDIKTARKGKTKKAKLPSPGGSQQYTGLKRATTAIAPQRGLLNTLADRAKLGG